MKRCSRIILIGIYCLIFYTPDIFSQTQSRTYANFQGTYRTGLYLTYGELVFGSVSNPGYSVDGDASTPSTLTIDAGLAGLSSVTQFLAFTTNGTLGTVRQINANVPVTIKFSLPTSLLGLAGNIEVGVFKNLQPVSRDIDGILGTGSGNAAGYKASDMTALYSGSSLIDLLNGAGVIELKLTPTQTYEGIYIKIKGELLSVNLSTQLFHAYIMENIPVSCSSQANAIDVLSGVRGNALINLLSATGTVNQPWSSVDNGSNKLSTYTTISTGAQVLSEVFQTIVYCVPSKAGDSLQLVLEDPGAGLLDLNLLGGMKIRPYLQSTPGSVILSSQAGLSLRLLSAGGTKYLLSVPVSTSFDRIDISLGGVADVLSQLRIYDAKRAIPDPVITENTGTRTADTVYVFKNTPLDLTASSSDPVSWYNSSGTWLADGAVYSISSVSADGIYTARSLRNGCIETSASHTVYVKALLHSALPVRELVVSAKTDDYRIRIDWTSKGESDVSHYTLQKLKDNNTFSDIAIVFAKEGDIDPSYYFNDNFPAAGKNIYRLVVHDRSGPLHYSKTVQADLNADRIKDQLQVSPNPADRQAITYLSRLDAGEYKLEIFNAGGTVVWQSKTKVNARSARTAIAPTHLQPGIYWLKATRTDNGRQSTMTIIIR